MRKKYSILLRSLIVAVTFAGFASCLGEDLDNCVDPRGNVRISLTIEPSAVSRTALDEYDIACVDVYVFDSNDKYITSVSGGRYTGEGYEFFLTLSEGDYRFVAWTNRGDSYKTNKTIAQCETETPPLEELELFLLCGAGDMLRNDIPDLLYGQQSQRITGARDNQVVVPMTPDTYTIRVKVKGLPELTDAFDFTITDNNSHYTFDNAIVAGKDNFLHLRSATQTAGELNVSLKTLRLMHGRTPQFVFANATRGETLFDSNLIQVIVNAYEKHGEQVDFDRTHTFEIVLTYDANMGVTVSVNGWEYRLSEQTLE